MPRRVLRFSRRRLWEAADLDQEFALCLQYWCGGVFGPEPSLKTRSDWAEAWNAWGEHLLPKFVARHPGCRPCAMYAAGLIPPVPLAGPLPAGWSPTVYFVGDDRSGGEGVEHLHLKGGAQRCEAAWLLEHGVIDRAEYRRHLETLLGHGLRCGWSDAAWRRA